MDDHIYHNIVQAQDNRENPCYYDSVCASVDTGTSTYLCRQI